MPTFFFQSRTRNKTKIQLGLNGELEREKSDSIFLLPKGQCCLNCPNCGREVTNQDATFCPYCAKPLRLVQKRTGLPLAAGILAIIPSCLIGFSGIAGLIAAAIIEPVLMVMALPFLALTILGLSAGIFMIKRRHLTFSILATSILLVSGAIFLVMSFAIPVSDITSALNYLWSTIMMVLSTLSLLFAAISRNEFS